MEKSAGYLSTRLGITPLMEAVAFSNEGECQILLESGVDLNEPAKSSSKETALIYAATIGSDSIFALLLMNEHHN